MYKKVIVLSVVLSSFLFSMDSDIKAQLKEATKTGVINENKILNGEAEVKENETVGENTFIAGEITPESIKAAKEDAERFEKSKKDSKDLDLEKNEKVENYLKKDLGKNKFIKKAEESINLDERRIKDIDDESFIPKENIKPEMNKESKLKVLKEGETFKIGSGPEHYYLFLEAGNEESMKLIQKHAKKLKENVTLHVFILNKLFNLESARKTTYILLGENDQERRERALSIFKDDSNKYKWSMIYRNIFGFGNEEPDLVINKMNATEKAAELFKIKVFPAMLDANLVKQDIKNINIVKKD